MAEVDPEQRRPMLTATRSGAGWRVPAVAVGAVLVALVALTRLGGSDRPTPTAAPSAVAAVPTVTSPRPRPSASAVVGRPIGAMPVSVDGLTYADGIPTEVSGQSVYRVRDALSFVAGRTLLVGGWYLDRSFMLRECAARLGSQCASPTISDVPLDGHGDVRTAFVALDSSLERTGAYVIRAIVETDPRCSIYAAGTCQPRLNVLASLWSAAV